MKHFKKLQMQCPYCHTWFPLQRLRLVPKKEQPEQFSDGEDADNYSRIYKCPRCDVAIARSPKKAGS